VTNRSAVLCAQVRSNPEILKQCAGFLAAMGDAMQVRVPAMQARQVVTDGTGQACDSFYTILTVVDRRIVARQHWLVLCVVPCLQEEGRALDGVAWIPALNSAACAIDRALPLSKLAE
jgi:hypothetical protein